MPRRFTIGEVKQIFILGGCLLLEDVYKNARTPMKYTCECGNESVITLSDFRNNCRCKQCGIKKLIQCFAYTLEEAKQLFNDGGAVLLATEYINNGTSMPYICSCGNKSDITLNRFQNGGRCMECGLKKSGQSRKGNKHYKWNSNRELVKNKATILGRCLKLLHRCLNGLNESKNCRTKDILGYTNDQLTTHITNHPNWKNIKDIEWHIDHIFPVSAFIEYGITDLKIINALDNLQPLDALTNMSKNDKYNKDKFYEYLQNHGLNINLM